MSTSDRAIALAKQLGELLAALPLSDLVVTRQVVADTVTSAFTKAWKDKKHVLN